MSAANALDADVDPECLRGMHETAELLAALGHDVVEDTPSLPGKDMLRIFSRVFGPAIALEIAYGEQLAGRAAGGRRDRAAVARAVGAQPQA